MDSLPIFAPVVQNFDFSNQLLTTAEKALELSSADPITHKNGISVHDQQNGILTDYLKIRNLSVNHLNENGEHKTGLFTGFRSLNLTWLPEASASLNSQFYTDENSNKRAFLFRSTENWTWREDCDTSPFQALVNSLNLEKIHLVRLIFLSPPAVGGVHIDTSPTSMDSYYRNKNGVSLTFNLLPGDGSLHFIRDSQIHSIAPTIKAWHFNPSSPHSVGKIEKLRVQLRVFGSMDPKKYLSMLDLNKAVY